MRRVVVTGLGVVAPNGIGKEAFWSACVNGKSGIGPIRSFDASEHPVHIAGEVPDFDMGPYLAPSQKKSLKVMGIPAWKWIARIPSASASSWARG
jgi:3-oxoacyl-[acyl-carrier-protein] synthase II